MSQKYAQVKLDHLPRVSGWKFRKYLRRNHHLVKVTAWINESPKNKSCVPSIDVTVIHNPFKTRQPRGCLDGCRNHGLVITFGEDIGSFEKEKGNRENGKHLGVSVVFLSFCCFFRSQFGRIHPGWKWWNAQGVLGCFYSWDSQHMDVLGISMNFPGKQTTSAQQNKSHFATKTMPKKTLFGKWCWCNITTNSAVCYSMYTNIYPTGSMYGIFPYI